MKNHFNPEKSQELKHDLDNEKVTGDPNLTQILLFGTERRETGERGVLRFQSNLFIYGRP
jgi:hypothetical protein